MLSEAFLAELVADFEDWRPRGHLALPGLELAGRQEIGHADERVHWRPDFVTLRLSQAYQRYAALSSISCFDCHAIDARIVENGSAWDSMNKSAKVVLVGLPTAAPGVANELDSQQFTRVGRGSRYEQRGRVNDMPARDGYFNYYSEHSNH
jgi:hypothetical protein